MAKSDAGKKLRDTRRALTALGFADSRHRRDRLVSLADGYESTGAEKIANQGPTFVEVGYGAMTIRVRMFHGTQLLKFWDIDVTDTARYDQQNARMLDGVRSQLEAQA